MDRDNIEKIAQISGDKMLLAKLWDKITTAMERNIPVHTCFLSLREQEMARCLFGDVPGLHAFGGHADTERKMLFYLPDYLDESTMTGENSPVVCLRAVFDEREKPGHRDFLGGLMNLGIAKDTVGDIYVGRGRCDIFVNEEIAQYVLQNFSNAGKTRFSLSRIPLNKARITKPKYVTIRDSLASLRLDSLVSAGYSMGRSLASQLIRGGKVAINGVPCEKPDKAVEEGCRVTLRGGGKIKLEKVKGQTKKGRISVVIHRYL